MHHYLSEWEFPGDSASIGLAYVFSEENIWESGGESSQFSGLYLFQYQFGSTGTKLFQFLFFEIY